MYSTPLQEALAALVPLTLDEQQALLCDPGLTHLAAVFARVPDPRRRLGRRYTLPFLLTCLVAAVLCNCNSTLTVEEWCRAHQALIRQVFGPLRHVIPNPCKLLCNHLPLRRWYGPSPTSKLQQSTRV